MVNVDPVPLRSVLLPRLLGATTDFLFLLGVVNEDPELKFVPLRSVLLPMLPGAPPITLLLLRRSSPLILRRDHR